MNETTKMPVIMDHDGSADDFLSLILLMKMDLYDLRAITITPADCYISNALETTLKILTKLEKENLPVGIGNDRGLNSFPAAWRAKPKILNALPDLININVDSITENHLSATETIISALMSNSDKTKILLTGPCTNLVCAIRKEPRIKDKIDEIIWMAGAFEVKGNVVTYDHDSSAEWNVYWDPISANTLLESNIPIVFIPLDVTNKVPVTIDFLKSLAEFNNFWSRLACQFWATTLDTIPAYEYTYFMWDVLATSYLAIPEAFKTKFSECKVLTSGPSIGNTVFSEGSGNYASVAYDVDLEKFYEYLKSVFFK